RGGPCPVAAVDRDRAVEQVGGAEEQPRQQGEPDRRERAAPVLGFGGHAGSAAGFSTSRSWACSSTCSNASICIRSWPAPRVMRRRALPSGTVGGRIAATQKPRSSSIAAIA